MANVCYTFVIGKGIIRPIWAGTLILIGLSAFGCNRAESPLQQEVSSWAEIATRLSAEDENWFEALEGNEFVFPSHLLMAVDISPYTSDEFVMLTAKICCGVPRYNAVQAGLLKQKQLGEIGRLIKVNHGGVRDALISSNLLP
jgi:hypothetical protein